MINVKAANFFRWIGSLIMACVAIVGLYAGLVSLNRSCGYSDLGSEGWIILGIFFLVISAFSAWLSFLLAPGSDGKPKWTPVRTGITLVTLVLIAGVLAFGLL